MNLKFILSLNFDQVNLEESDCNGIVVLLSGRIFNVRDGEVSSGIFKHQQNKNLFLVIYEGFIFIGLLGISGFDSYVELARIKIFYDEELYRKIIEMTVEEYTKSGTRNIGSACRIIKKKPLVSPVWFFFFSGKY